MTLYEVWYLISCIFPQDDLLQWLLEKGIQRGSTDANVLERLLLVNFAAIHTTTYVRSAILTPADHALMKD